MFTPVVMGRRPDNKIILSCLVSLSSSSLLIVLVGLLPPFYGDAHDSLSSIVGVPRPGRSCYANDATLESKNYITSYSVHHQSIVMVCLTHKIK